MKKDAGKQENMKFEYKITGECVGGHFSVMKDRSLLYSACDRCFSVLPGGDWRFELNVDCETRRCINFQGTLIGNIQKKDLNIPCRRKGELFFRSDEKLIAGTGCHYLFIADCAYYDPVRKILCVGDPSASGVAIEFADNTTAVICDKNLAAIYADLKDAYIENDSVPRI